MKKIVGLGLAVAMLLCLVAGCGKTEQAQQNKTGDKLVVAMELAYPPFETKDENGEPTGVSVDFAKALGEYIGRPTEIVNTAWDGLIPSLQTGKADAVISSMTITEARAEQVDFSEPYANSLLAILANKNAGVKDINDLNAQGKKVAVKNGSTGHVYAQNNLQNAELVVLSDESACVTEVAQGKADAFLYGQDSIYKAQRANPDTTEAIFVPYQKAEKWGVAVQKGNAELLSQINAFIKKYTDEGGFDALSDKYLSEEKAAFAEYGFTWYFDLSKSA